MNKLSVLIIDDEETQRESIAGFFRRRDYLIYTAGDGLKGDEAVGSNVIDVVLTDFRMPGLTGLEVLQKVKQINPEIDVVVITAYGSVQDAVDIMKAGAYDYLTKPIDLDELENLLNRLQEKRGLQSENKLLKQQLQEKFRFDSIISQSKEMEEVLSTASRVANSKATVLIRGESGTGKELIAKAIHFSSNRKDKPFITVNIAALSENLLESELFGHEKGSFTGAANQRIGKFELADQGTIFIDEIGEIPATLQVKLLRVLQFGEIERVGAEKSKKIDVRIIGATHRNLEEMITKSEFREDLYYRINVVPVLVSPLRKRKIDIPLLIDHFIKKFAEENQKQVTDITKEALDKLIKYEYPGNIRELENIIEHAVVLTRNEQITLKDLPVGIRSSSEKGILDPYDLNDSYDIKVDTFEKEMLLEALRQANNNQSAAARLLGISERHVRSRLERLGLK
ncbi:MAG: sigma-54-dependent Fis family transcriptional regulator [Ignavibacteriales bacterium]|nr:sigma-54-dependent Fis family transcriptional regulator [Ignavibacteriales bacterium]